MYIKINNYFTVDHSVQVVKNLRAHKPAAASDIPFLAFHLSLPDKTKYAILRGPWI